MSSVQTAWCQMIAATLADAGVATCVISPGSRSTPLVAAMAAEERLGLVTIIDERAAAFYALGVARATGMPAAVVCTSGTAAAHYLPAIVEASLAGVPLIAITADRPPELQQCGASQTIDQVKLYGGFVRGAFDLGAPTDNVRALRRSVVHAITLARGPHAGPVQLEVPLGKPLEPDPTVARPAPARIELAVPRLIADRAAVAALAQAIAAEPDGIIVAGALPVGFARDAVLSLAERAGYPVIAEAASQLRFGPRAAVMLDHLDVIPVEARPAPKLVIQIGAEPVAASWPQWKHGAQRWVLAGATWTDPDGGARVILGEVAEIARAIVDGTTEPSASSSMTRFGDRGGARVRTAAWLETWASLEARAARAAAAAIEAAPASEVAVLRAAIAALPASAALQIGNSLPIRTIDHIPGGGPARAILSQRGAAGIDGLIASAAGATRAGAPVLLVLGDVSFAHDLGGLLAARAAVAPLAVLVLDNRGGQIFAGLPVAGAQLGDAFARHWLTAPEVDPVAVATALGARAIRADSPAAAAAAIRTALATAGVTVIHAPVSDSGARDVRRAALELFARGATP